MEINWRANLVCSRLVGGLKCLESLKMHILSIQAVIMKALSNRRGLEFLVNVTRGMQE